MVRFIVAPNQYKIFPKGHSMVYFCYVLSFDNLIYLVYKFRKKFFEKSVRLWFRSCLYRCKGKNQKGGLSMNDKDIIQLYLNRDQRALSATAKKYGKYCTSIAKNILGNNEDAEECVNDTYLSTWNSIPPTIPTILSAFLGKITRNLALNIYKSKNCQKRKGEVPLVLDELKECIPSQNDIDTEMEEKYLTKYINEFLKSLPREKRIIIVQRYWYLYSIKDIAEKNNLSQSNVKMTLSRFRTKLKEFLEERGQYI